MIAAYHGHLKIVEQLIQNNCNLQLEDCFGKTAGDRAKGSECKNLISVASMDSKIQLTTQAP